MYKLKLLYLEDEQDIANELIEILNILNVITIHAKNYDEAIHFYKSNKFDIIISDIELPGKNGLEFLKEVRIDNTKIPIVITSACSDTDYMLESIELSITRYLIKPISINNLKDTLNKVREILNDNNITVFNHNFKYDSKNKYFLNNDKVIKITNQEIILIELLIANQNSIVPFLNLQYALEKDKNVSLASLRTLIKKLRKNTYKDIIESVSGIGYRLNYL